MSTAYKKLSDKAKSNHKARTKVNTLLYIERNQHAVLEYLQSHPCIDCGETDPIILEFDHVQENKEAPIAFMLRRAYSLKKIMGEIDKCVVRCANCHRRKTAKQLDWFRWRVEQK